MAIVVQAEPAGARDMVHAALAQRANRAGTLDALRGAPQTAVPLPVYVLGAADAALADPLAAATRVGWRYPVVGGAAPGLAYLREDAAGLTFAGLSHGAVVGRLLDAAVLAEDNLGARPENFEPRLLEIPALRLCALWMRGAAGSNFFITLLDGERPIAGPLQLERSIQPRVAAALAGRRIRARRAVLPAASHVARPRDVHVPVLALGAIAVAVPFGAPSLDWLGQNPLAAWLIELILILLLFAAVGIGSKGYWFGILVDGRNKISLSRLQIVLWTILFVATLFVSFVWNVGHVTDLGQLLTLKVPDAVWVLMGLSGASAAGTPLILSAKPEPAPGAAPPPTLRDPAKYLDGIVVKRRPDARPRWSDVMLGDEAGNGGSVDISKVQQILLSVVAVLVYGYAIGRTLAAAKGAALAGLPEMATGFLALIGVSHATYLVYKAVPHSN